MNIHQKEFAVAPMLDVTDRHCRAFLRQFSRHFRMYTEMVVANSIIYGDQQRFLEFDESENPVVLQLGGCDPDKLGACAQIGEEYGYDEINLNVGCPSDRVKSAQFGACLMAKPQLVAECVAEMNSRVSIPVSVKTRLGIDDQDSYAFLCQFVDAVSAAGCGKLIVHARKAWLSGLSPKENRNVPRLHYDRVYRLKRDYSNLDIIINGGIESIESIVHHLQHTDGIMMGREIYQNPWKLKVIEDHFFNQLDESCRSAEDDFNTRVNAINAFLPYVEQQLNKGVYLRHMTRHMLGAFHGVGGAKSWRRYLSENGPLKSAGVEVIERALELVYPRESSCQEDNVSGFRDRAA